MADSNVGTTKKLSQEYLTVIYGLITTEGLREFILDARHSDLRLSTSLILFGATFLQALHFWMTAVTAEKAASDAYGLINEQRPRHRILILLADMLFATAIAGCILTMFLNLNGDGRLFFHFFLILAMVSFCYDLFALVLSSLAELLRKKVATSGEKAIRSDYRKLAAVWLFQDTYCVAGCWFTYHLVFPRYWSSHPLLVACVYATLVVAFFAIDVLCLHWRTYHAGLLR
jgi:hypothetical protein